MATGMVPTHTGLITGSTTLSSVQWFHIVLALVTGAYLTVVGLGSLSTQHYYGAMDRLLVSIQEGKLTDPLLREATRIDLRASRDGSVVAMSAVIAIDEAVRLGVKTPDGQVWLKRGISDLRNGLSRSPADGLAWLRLAGAERLLNGPSSDVLDAIRMAAFTMRSRLDGAPLFLSMCASLWPRLGPEVRSVAKSLVLSNWNHRPWRARLRKLAVSQSGRDLLKTAVGDVEELDKWIANQVAEDKRLQERQMVDPEILRR